MAAAWCSTPLRGWNIATRTAPGWRSARDMGHGCWHNCPSRAEIAVLDTRLGSPAAFQADRGAAKDRITRLETVANSQPLTARRSTRAVKLLRQSTLARKEIYVFTDLSRGGLARERGRRGCRTAGRTGRAWAFT